jgi:hypothetical protein
MLLAAGAAAASLAVAMPAAAQYYPPAYPGYPPAYPGYPPAVPQVPDYGDDGYAPNGYNQSYITSTCASAVQARLNGNYGYRGYGYGRGRVLGITRVEPRENGNGWRVWGVASGGYGYNQGPDIIWSCRTDFRGVVVDVDLKRGNYGYNYTPWGDNDAPYGYRRY